MPNFVGKIYVIDQKPSPILAVYQCGWQQCGPNHSYGPGIWDHYVIHYIIKGKGEFTCGGKTYPIQAGQGFMIPPNTTAYYRADNDDPWEYHWVGFNGTEARKMLEKAKYNLRFDCVPQKLIGLMPVLTFPSRVGGDAHIGFPSPRRARCLHRPIGNYRIRRKFSSKRMIPPRRCGHRPLRESKNITKTGRAPA